MVTTEKTNRMDIHQMCVQNPLKIVEIYKVTMETLIITVSNP